MYWTLELASYLADAPWPATKDELIDYSIRTGAPLEVAENLQDIEDEGDSYDSIIEIWPDYPTEEDYLNIKKYLTQKVSFEAFFLFRFNPESDLSKNPDNKYYFI